MKKLEKIKKALLTWAFFPVLFAICWIPAIILKSYYVTDAVVVPLFLAPFAVFVALWIASKIKK